MKARRAVEGHTGSEICFDVTNRQNLAFRNTGTTSQELDGTLPKWV